MNNILEHEYLEAKQNFTRSQEKALASIVKKEHEIKKTQKEIEKILQQNNLNNLDVDKYKRDEQVNTFINLDFSK